MKKILVGTFALALVAFASAAFAAGSAPADLGLSVTVVNNCTITTTPVAFGNYDPLSATPTDNSGAVKITCTKGGGTSITLGNGLHFNSPDRQLSDGTQVMTYELYQPQGGVCNYSGATRWGTTGGEIFAVTAAPSKAERTYNVCGRIAAGQDVSAAAFADTVVATVNF